MLKGMNLKTIIRTFLTILYNKIMYDVFGMLDCTQKGVIN